MKRTLLMPCLLAVGVAVVVVLAAGVEGGTLLVWGAVLACPLMMLLMMGGMFGMARHHGAKKASENRQGKTWPCDLCLRRGGPRARARREV